MFSRKTHCALKVLVHLAVQKPKDYRTTRELAEACACSHAVLSKTVRALARAGFVVTKKGPTGGVRLRRDPASLTMEEVLDRFGELEPQPARRDGCCRPEGYDTCIVESLIDEYRSKVLSDSTLEDVAEEVREP